MNNLCKFKELIPVKILLKKPPPYFKKNTISNKINKQVMSTGYLVDYRRVQAFAVTSTALAYVSASSWYYKYNYNTGVANTF